MHFLCMFYLHNYEDNLDHRECDFNSGVTVKVSHVAGYLENVHDDTEEPEQHKSS